jgi:transcription elongation factor Elf1
MTQATTTSETRRAGAECRHCHSRNTVQVAQVSDRVNHELWVRSECRDCGRSTETRFGHATRITI